MTTPTPEAMQAARKLATEMDRAHSFGGCIATVEIAEALDSFAEAARRDEAKACGALVRQRDSESVSGWFNRDDLSEIADAIECRGRP